MKKVTIIGAGLAGCEAALQLARRGFDVFLYDQKNIINSDLYTLDTFAELVCNNSFGPSAIDSPLGLLLHELKMLDSELLKIADECRLIDNKNFAVDRHAFSQKVTNRIIKQGIKLRNERIDFFIDDHPLIISTGPLTDERLASEISIKYGVSQYNFSDASSPIFDINSIDLRDKRIKKRTNDLYEVYLDSECLERFYKKLCSSLNNNYSKIIDKEVNLKQCQSIEYIAKKGKHRLIEDKLTQPNINMPVLLLRREKALENSFLLVGCMTTLRQIQQKEVFSLLPGFKDCRFIKYGRMHRNTFFNSPEILNCFYQIRNTDTYLIGQISGIDGYAPAISSGMVSAFHIASNKKITPLPQKTMIGALARYVCNNNITDFQPMCANYALLEKDIGISTPYANSKKALSNWLKENMIKIQ